MMYKDVSNPRNIYSQYPYPLHKRDLRELGLIFVKLTLLFSVIYNIYIYIHLFIGDRHEYIYWTDLHTQFATHWLRGSPAMLTRR